MFPRQSEYMLARGTDIEDVKQLPRDLTQDAHPAEHIAPGAVHFGYRLQLLLRDSRRPYTPVTSVAALEGKAKGVKRGPQCDERLTKK